ncbi:MAG: hypothetical protein ACTSYX_12130 [Candidatus Thorarchaeota archaeon]
MTSSDLLHLLRIDLRQSFRLTNPSGKRTEKKRRWTAIIPDLVMVFIGVIAGVTISLVGNLFGWAELQSMIANGVEAGALLFNALFILSFVGAIMFSATTVGNTSRMEYLLTMPLAPRTIFIEKQLVLILNGSRIWWLIGGSILVMVSLTWGSPSVLFSLVAFMVLMLVMIALAVASGGILGLVVSRLVAGRRTLKQVGYFVLTALAIVGSALWYYMIYFGDDNGMFFGTLLDIACSLGFSSRMTPGYITSDLVLGTMAGVLLSVSSLIGAFAMCIVAITLVYANGVLSEAAHYSGWLMVDTTRSSARDIVVAHEVWDPQPLPRKNYSQTLSVSAWYNLTSIRREGRVLAQYLLNPLRFAIFLFIPILSAGPEFSEFLPFLILAAMIPFATSYGIYFAGYETVYEGKNLMNLQLAAANMEEYVRGKVYSAMPFSLGVAVIFAVLVAILTPTMIVYAPLLVAGAVFTTMFAGAYAAHQAAANGDFKAERMILRQRGSPVRPPIGGIAMLKTQIVPGLVAYAGLIGAIAVGVIFNPLGAYLGLALYALLCQRGERKYSRSAGVLLAKLEASEYL